MKLFKSLMFPLLAFVLIFASCAKENIDETTTPVVTDPDVIEYTSSNPLLNRSSGDNEEGLNLDCFTILYTFELVYADGSTASVDSEESFFAALSDSINYVVDFVYPLTVADENGETSTVNTGEELGELFASCVPSGGWNEDFFPAYLINYDNSCYAIQYPISVVDLSGEVTTIGDEEAFNAAVAEEPLSFVFPITLVHEDGESLAVNDIDELFDALISCNGFEIGDSTEWDWEGGFEYIGCYIMEFPLSVVVANGDVVVVNNHMELCDLMLIGEIVDYAYPLTLTDEEGNTVIVNSQEELFTLLDDCSDWEEPVFEGGLIYLLYALSLDQGPGYPACYSINYPITVQMNADCIEVVFESQEDLALAIDTQPICDVVLPVTVTMSADGSQVVVSNIESLLTLIENCQ